MYRHLFLFIIFFTLFWGISLFFNTSSALACIWGFQCSADQECTGVSERCVEFDENENCIRTEQVDGNCTALYHPPSDQQQCWGCGGNGGNICGGQQISTSLTCPSPNNCNACPSSSGGGTTTTTPTCSDGIKNGNETGVDCGGSCSACITFDLDPITCGACEHLWCLGSCINGNNAEKGYYCTDSKGKTTGPYGCGTYFNSGCLPVCGEVTTGCGSGSTLYCNDGLSNCGAWSSGTCGTRTCYYTTFTGTYCGVSYTNNTSINCQHQAVTDSKTCSGGGGGGGGGSIDLGGGTFQPVCPPSYSPPGRLCGSGLSCGGWSNGSCGCMTCKYESYLLPDGTYTSDCQQPTIVQSAPCYGTPSYGTPESYGTPYTSPYSTPAFAWWQVKDSDVLTNQDIVSIVPSTLFFGLNGDGGFPGVPVYGQNLDISPSQISNKGWRAKARYGGKTYTYDWFASLLPADTETVDCASGCTISGGDLVSKAQDSAKFIIYNGNLTLNSQANLNNKRVQVFITGDFNIKGDIKLDKGKGFFGAVVKGNINVDPSVSSGAGSSTPNLEGFFVADGQFFTGQASSRLNVRGSVVAWRGVFLQRTFASNSSPAEYFEYAPDLIFTYPTQTLRSGISWKEVAP